MYQQYWFILKEKLQIQKEKPMFSRLQNFLKNQISEIINEELCMFQSNSDCGYNLEQLINMYWRFRALLTEVVYLFILLVSLSCLGGICFSWQYLICNIIIYIKSCLIILREDLSEICWTLIFYNEIFIK